MPCFWHLGLGDGPQIFWEGLHPAGERSLISTRQKLRSQRCSMLKKPPPGRLLIPRARYCLLAEDATAAQEKKAGRLGRRAALEEVRA